MSSNRYARDRHVLYEASVQEPEVDLDLFERMYRKRNGRKLRLFREDFCGTSAMSCEWVRRGEENRAWCVDKHRPTLEWGRRHHVSRLGKAADRVNLIHADVLTVSEPKIEFVAALNFSYMIFKERELLRRYFRKVRDSLLPGGMFILDAFGGTESTIVIEEPRKIPASRAPDGSKVPPFTYCWEQARYNIIDHNILCYIHFKLKDGTKIKRAFTYNWRLWTLPELQEVLLEAGFDSAEVYLDNWDEEEQDGDGVYRRRKFHENQLGWVGYVAGLT